MIQGRPDARRHAVQGVTRTPGRCGSNATAARKARLPRGNAFGEKP